MGAVAILRHSVCFLAIARGHFLPNNSSVMCIYGQYAQPDQGSTASKQYTDTLAREPVGLSLH